MSTEPKIEDLLEIVLVTYNRSAYLDNTLSQFKDSPFANCRFTVLDNCSTDDTAAVVARYAKYFPNFQPIRHPRNIGGDYNFLRAIEVSTLLYTWVICDDDAYDFSSAAEAIAAVTSCKYRMVYVASRTSESLDWSGFGATTSRSLTGAGVRYHRACTFWPSFIFQTKDYINFCFQNAPYLFPSFKFLNYSIEHDFKLYVLEKPLVIRCDLATGEQRPLVFYKEWVTNAALIEDKELRGYVIDQWTEKGFFRTLAFWIAMERLKRQPGYWKMLVDIAFGLTPVQRLKFLLLLPVMIVPLPRNLLLAARQQVYRIMGHRDSSNLPPVEVGR